MRWQEYRQMLMAIAFAGVFCTLGRFGLDSRAGDRSVAAFAFPEVIPLPGWQLSKSGPAAKAVPNRADTFEAVLASRKYNYRQNNQQLDVEMHYIAGTLGDLRSYLGGYASVKLEDAQLLQNLRQREGVGFYSLFTYQGRSHLSACINPRGGSTVTSAQFFANRRTYDLRLERLGPWLLGQESLRDRRCLWQHLSMPLSHASAEQAYPILEQTWLASYQWWRHRFPPH